MKGATIYTEEMFVDAHLGGVPLETVRKILKSQFPENFV